jgi:hypothetical protein
MLRLRSINFESFGRAPGAQAIELEKTGKLQSYCGCITLSECSDAVIERGWRHGAKSDGIGLTHPIMTLVRAMYRSRRMLFETCRDKKSGIWIVESYPVIVSRLANSSPVRGGII